MASFQKKKKERGLFIPPFAFQLGLSPIEREILSLIFNISRTGEFFASNQYIANYVKTSEATVKRSIRKIKQQGFVFLKHIDGKRYMSLSYDNINKIKNRNDKISEGQNNTKAVQNDPESRSKVNNFEGQNEPIIKRVNKNEIKISDILDFKNLKQDQILKILHYSYPTNSFNSDEINVISEFSDYIKQSDKTDLFERQMRFLPKFLQMKNYKPPNVRQLIGTKQEEYLDGLWMTTNWEILVKKMYKEKSL